MKRTITAICLCLALSACGTTGQLSTEQLHSRIPAGESRIVFERDHSFQYAASEARVNVNGQVLEIGLGGQAMTDVKAGHISITLDTPLSPGDFSTSIEAVAGKTYHFTITSNSDMSLAPLLLGGVIADGIRRGTSRNSGYFVLERK